MGTESELETASQLADARLGVAEVLAWPFAMLAAVAAHLAWEYWLITILVAVAGYYGTTYRYRRDSAAAEDRYYKAAGLGKYVGQGNRDV